MVFWAATIYPNLKIQVCLKTIDEDVEKGDGDVSSGYGLKTSTPILNGTIQVPLIRLVSVLTRAMLVVNIVLWTSIPIYNRMVTISSREELQ